VINSEETSAEMNKKKTGYGMKTRKDLIIQIISDNQRGTDVTATSPTQRTTRWPSHTSVGLPYLSHLICILIVALVQFPML
jgi:hypothetical protein